MNKNKNKNKKNGIFIDFDDILKKELKNPEFKKHYDEYGKQLEIAYQILQLRKKKNISQAQLAKKIGTKQSNIARMESGQQNFSIDILEKIAEALGCNVKIMFCR
jgi:ribosome-binding protein aMBF1 (putative translation factor)